MSLFHCLTQTLSHTHFYRALLQKRPIILRSLLIVATLYNNQYRRHTLPWNLHQQIKNAHTLIVYVSAVCLVCCLITDVPRAHLALLSTYTNIVYLCTCLFVLPLQRCTDGSFHLALSSTYTNSVCLCSCLHRCTNGLFQVAKRTHS